MNKNIGKTDKIVRVVLGVVIIGAGVFFQSWWGAIGVIPLGTALTGVCLAYIPFGISTCKTEGKAS
ncbi:MAG: DUF2892 domain-containing protein [Leptospiraceae bacterium]|nr:DUF2892 domain-containing protein [Leptospiraceae bacterium]